MKWLSGGRLARRVFAGVAIITGLALTPARAEIVVQIDKSSQRMAVSVDGATRYNWPVSTGRDGYGTPSGITRRAWRGTIFRANITMHRCRTRSSFITASPFTAPTI